MALAKVTFTLDAATVALIEDAAARLALPKSRIVREAVQEFHAGIDHLSRREKTEMLGALAELLPRIPSRSAPSVARELAGIRRTRRAGGRRSPAESS